MRPKKLKEDSGGTGTINTWYSPMKLPIRGSHDPELLDMADSAAHQGTVQVPAE